MRRALIFTLQWSDNYGSVLQAYALQAALKKLGVDAAIAPIFPDSQRGVRRFVGRSVGASLKKISSAMGRGLKRRLFSGFREMHFDYGGLEPIPFSSIPGRKFGEFDTLVYGSDNIWGAARKVDPRDAEVFFALHVDHPRKIAYAASSGGNLAEDPVRHQVFEYVVKGGFQSISCREDSSVRAFAAAGIPSVRVPDPTLLLSMEEWERLEVPCGIREPFVFGYDMGHRSGRGLRDVCREVAGCGALVKMLYPNAWLRNFLFGLQLTPAQWLCAIHHARCVVTNSFHGIAFCVRFRRPFLYIPIVGESARYNGRACELLEKCGLEGRIYGGGDAKRQMASEIDWEATGTLLRGFVEEGLAFLRDNFK